MTTIENHRLEHIPALKVDPEIFLQRFAPESAMCKCNGTCCSEGVLVDLKEKERILRHADVIKRYLEPHQVHDQAQWFDECVEDDHDFPSGKCDGTAVHGNGCVFLDSQGLCALQKTAMAEGMHKFALKPFYCVAFPLTIDEHVLTTYEPEFTNRQQCCSVVTTGPQLVIDVCKEEIEYMLGADGLKEVETLFQQYAPGTGNSR